MEANATIRSACRKKNRAGITRLAGMRAIVLLACMVSTAVSAEEISAGGCSVRLLSKADASEVPRVYRDAVVDPQDRDRESIRNALPLLPELSCKAVNKVVFVERAKNIAEDGWVNGGSPDLVFINYAGSNSSAKVSQTFLHESTHAADLLLNAFKADTGILEGLTAEELFPKGEADAGDWDPAIGNLAKSVVKSNRLGAGFRALWVALQRNFRDFGLAGDYLVPQTVTRERIVDGETVEVEETEMPVLAAPEKAGFMSNYGATGPGEDIAEFAGWMLAAPLFDGVEADSRMAREFHYHACDAMRASEGAAISKDLAAVYTKANLLLSAGLVTQKAYDLCVGKLKIDVPGKGVFVYGVNDESSQLKRSFTNDVKVSIGTHPKLGEYVFQFGAGGRAPFGDKDYDADVELQLVLGSSDLDIDKISWPRGIFNLKHIGNKFEVLLPDQRWGSFVGVEGFVLVSHADSDRIEGSVFLQHAVRVFSSPPVPQTGLPLRFLFKITK